MISKILLICIVSWLILGDLASAQQPELCYPTNENKVPYPTWCRYTTTYKYPGYGLFNYTLDYQNYTCSSNEGLTSTCAMINGIGFVETTVGPSGLLFTTTTDHIILLNNQTGNFSVYEPPIPMKNMTFIRSFMIGSFAHVLIGSPSSTDLMLLRFDYDLKMTLRHTYSYPDHIVEDAQYTWSGEYIQGLFQLQDSPYEMAILLRHRSTQKYSVKFTSFVAKENVFIPDYMTWSVSSEHETGAMQMTLETLQYQPIDPVVSDSNTRVLLMLANNTFMHIYALDRTNSDDIELPFGDMSDPTFFYYTTDATIEHATIYPETTLRSFPSGAVASTSAVWVLTHEKNSTLEYLRGLLLMSFAASENYTVLNPTGQNNTAECEFGWYVDPGLGQCTNMSSFILPLNDTALNPDHVFFRDVPSFGTDYGGVETSSTPYKAIFVVKDASVYIYAVSAESDPQSFGLDYMSNHTFMSKPAHIGLTYNGAYFLTAMEKPLWELLSAERYYHTCEDLKNITWEKRQLYESADKSFHSLDKQCNQSNYRLPSLVDFVQYIGICPGMLFCPSFFTNDQPPLVPGQYVVNSYQLSICEAGWYCNSLGPHKCPYGFYCPKNSSEPIACPYSENLNVTCFEEALAAPKVCPDGFACIAPYLPPVPSPPGYYIIEKNNVSRATFANCTWGEYCNLGRYDHEDRRCPAGAYCADPEVEFPKACSCDAKNFSTCSYCPAGTTFDQPCPAGFYCQGPKNISACYNTQYCPPGTVEAKPCPLGHYCPTPSEKNICPAGHFCAVGSVDPKACTVFTFCPEGTGEPSLDFGIIVFTCLAVAVLISAWKIFHHVQDKQRAIREQIRLQAIAAKQHVEGDANGMDSINGNFVSKNRIDYLGGVKEFYVDFTFNELGLEINAGKNRLKILEGVTGEIKHGRLTAVMGPSGSGKTTFITTLAGKIYHGKLSGEILINGAPSNIESLRKITGFVPQDDIMLRTLTVKETLTFYANLRLPREFSSKQRRKTVNRVIDLLGLYDVRHSVVGDETERGISGGQRKRVNIGMELVADPTVLFLDEPTSGLDASTAKEVCESLRRVTEKGMTVIAVIHQPRYEIFQMFHDVMLMGKGGKVVFAGPSEAALPYFEQLGFYCPPHSNPADFFMDVISGLKQREGHPEFKPDDLARLWEMHKRDFNGRQVEENGHGLIIHEEPEERDENSPLLSQRKVNANREKYLRRKTAGFFSQFARYALRSFVQQMRDFKAIFVDFFLLFLSGSLLGAVFMNKTYKGPLPDIACDGLKIDVLKDTCTLPLDDPYPQIYGLSALVLALTAAASALKVFGSEKLVFYRENASGASALAYFTGKDFAQLPVLLTLPLFFTGILYTLLTPRANFFDLYLAYFLTCYCSYSIGYFVSVIVKPSIAQVASVVAILICMVFSGLRPGLAEFAKMNVVLKFLPNLSFLRWANELLYLRELWEWKAIFKVEKGVEALDYVLTQEQIQWDHIFIALIAVVFRVFSYLLMLVINRDKRK